MNAEYWIEKLQLQPHVEGGYFREIYRSEQKVKLVNNSEKIFHAGTDIYFLLGSPSEGQFSAWHYLENTEEIWHHHVGDDVKIYYIDNNAQLQTKLLGMSEQAEPLIHIPANCWFAAAVNNPAPSAYALLSCACFPGFDYNNFRLAERNTLIAEYPQHQQIIKQFTRG